MTERKTWSARPAWRTYAAAALWAAAAAVGLAAGTPDRSGWLQIRHDVAGILYLLAVAVGAANFVPAGVRALRSLRLDMNALMSLAIAGAVLIGESFEAASLAVLFSFAELLERYAVDRGRNALGRLLELVPEHAERLEPSGIVARVRVDDLRVGDVVRIRPGGKVPADGTVVSGRSAVNEATITGESLPRAKAPGDAVFASTLNTDGALDVEVTVDASNGTLARMVRMVRTAEAQRAPVEQFVRRFARVYTPSVVGLAVVVMILPPILTGGSGLEWFVRGLTMLVIACPCALVIATPVTVVSALTSAARHGVLIKGGEHLEALGAVRALAVDKTGTLTTGRLRVTAFNVTGSVAEPEMLRLVAVAESRSEHPVARAIVTFAHGRGVATTDPVEEFTAVPGLGVRARVGEQSVAVGSAAFVGAPAEALGGESVEVTRVFARAGLANFARFDLADELRPESAAAIAELHGLGVKPIVVLTGDGEPAAQAAGRAAGVDEVHAQLLPEGKVVAVRALRERHGAVAMLGDGVNDAPALVEASVGIAMGSAGSPATIETADIALMADDFSKLPYAVRLARRARRVVRANIAVALALKLTLAVGAGLGLVGLATAVLVGDVGGTVLVTFNALRVARIRPEESA